MDENDKNRVATNELFDIIFCILGVVLCSILLTFTVRSLIKRTRRLQQPPNVSSLDTQDDIFTTLQQQEEAIIATEGSHRDPYFNVDPVSASLARQSVEERAGYYKSPSRTSVPYYKYKATNNNLTDDGEEEYKVW